VPQYIILYPSRVKLYIFYRPPPDHIIPLTSQEAEEHLDLYVEAQASDSQLESLISGEAGGTELSLLFGNGTSANSTTSDGLSNATLVSLSGLLLELNQRVGVGAISGGIDGANHARLAMVVLVLCAVEGDRIGVLDGHCEGWLTGFLARLAEQESRVERATGLAGGAAASSSRCDGMVSSNPNELDCVTNVGGDSSGVEDPLATCANLDLVGGSIDGRSASRSSNDELGEMHG